MSFTRLRSLYLLLVCIALAAPAAAAAPAAEAPPAISPMQMLRDYLSTADYMRQLNSFVPTTEPEVLRRICPTPKPIDFGGITVLEPPVFNEHDSTIDLTKGTWIDAVNVDRCGERVIRRFLVQVNGTNQLKFARLLPGEFRGDIQIEQAVIANLAPGLVKAANCAEPGELVVEDIKALGPLDPKTGWRELWATRVCSKILTAVITYTPMGSTINMQATDIKVSQ